MNPPMRVFQHAPRVGHVTKTLSEEEKYRHLARRRGKKRAAVAVARTLLTTIYHIIRKGQIEGVEKGNIQGQNEFITGLFGLAA